jgi:7-keto-8-aminopelargonate synthetase-like enzyme
MSTKTILEAAGKLAPEGDLRLASGRRFRGWQTGRSNRQIIPPPIGENQQRLSAAEYLESDGFAVQAGWPPTVPHWSARLQFSLTSRSADDELVRLEDCQSSWRDHAWWSAAVARA